MYKTREKVENWLKEMGIKNYVINEDLTVDVNGNVDLYNKQLKEIPVQFGIVKGNFNCNANYLTSLNNCPNIIKGNFYCRSNNLTNLEYFPKEVNGDFHCYNNSLTSLEWCPKEVNGDFHCYNNKLTSLKGCVEKIKGNFYCNNNDLTSLEYFPKKIKGEFIAIDKNKIKEEELVNFNCDIKNIKKIYSDFNNYENKKEFLEKIIFYKNIKKESELLKDLSINSNNVKLNKKL